MGITKEHYYSGISLHKFKPGPMFAKYRGVLREIYDCELREGYRFEKKYAATEDLRPQAYTYDKTILGALVEAGIHQKMIDIFGYELFPSHVQIRISYNQNEFSYMPWHRDSYMYEDGKQIGPCPPYKKVIYFPQFDNINNECMLFAPGTHLSVKNNRSEDVGQLDDCTILQLKSSVDEFVIFNTEALHHALPPPSGKQMRVIYSFCPKGQLNIEDKPALYNEYMSAI